MPGRYAADTSVSVEKSKAEIEATLMRYGAAQFVSGWDDSGKAMIGFQLANRSVRMTLQLPRPNEERFLATPGRGLRRTPEDARRAHEQACRQQWRALALVVKAKLEAVEAGISTFEREFLADIVMPNGKTLGGWLQPQIEAAYKGGKMPALLAATN